MDTTEKKKFFSLERIILGFKLFQKGSKLFNSQKWKSRTVKTNLVLFVTTLVALLASFGFELQLSESDISLIAAGLIAFVNAVMGAITDEEVGIKPKNTPEQVKKKLK